MSQKSTNTVLELVAVTIEQRNEIKELECKLAEAYAKNEELLRLQNVSTTFDLLIERLGKCFDADPQNNGDVFDPDKAAKGWEHRENELKEKVEELESKFNLC